VRGRRGRGGASDKGDERFPTSVTMEAARLVFDKEPAVGPEQPLSQGQIERRIQHFIATTLRPGEQMSLVGLDDVLLADGLLDSLSILRLIVFIEEEFGVSVPEEAWQPEHFQTIKRLAACVQRLHSAATATSSVSGDRSEDSDRLANDSF
jgi:acyl carrier protein